MSDVTRCDYLYNEEGELQLEELPTGRFVRHSDYATLLTSYNALVEAVAWEREFDETLVWLVQTGRYPRDMAGKYDLANERECASDEVDRLVGGGRKMSEQKLKLTVKPCGDCWLHIDAPSGKKASINLGQRGGFNDQTIVGQVIREVAEMLEEK